MSQIARIAVAAAPVMIVLTQPAMAQGEAEWAESPQYFDASEVPAGQQTYTERQEMARIPTRWFHAARLAEGVSVQFGEEQHDFAAGDVLPQLVFMPDGTRSSAEIAYCTPRNRGENTTRSGLMGSLFGGSLWDSLARDATDTQYCLRDTDGDGTFDASFLVGEGEDDFIRGTPVANIGFEVADGAEVSGEDYVAVSAASVGRRHVEFRFTFVQQGHTLDFTNFSSGAYRAFSLSRESVRDGYPVAVDIAGMRFAITAHDRAADSVTVEWAVYDKPEQVMLPESYQRSFY